MADYSKDAGQGIQNLNERDDRVAGDVFSPFRGEIPNAIRRGIRLFLVSGSSRWSYSTDLGIGEDPESAAIREQRKLLGCS